MHRLYRRLLHPFLARGRDFLAAPLERTMREETARLVEEIRAARGFDPLEELARIAEQLQSLPERVGNPAELAQVAEEMRALRRRVDRPDLMMRVAFEIQALNRRMDERDQVMRLLDEFRMLGRRMDESDARSARLLMAMEERLLAMEQRAGRQLAAALERGIAPAGGNLLRVHLPGAIPLLFEADDQDMATALLMGRPWQPDVLQALLGLLRPGSVILDVGAGPGFFAVQLARRLAGGRVHAIEPAAPQAALLRRNTGGDGHEARVAIHVLPPFDLDRVLPGNLMASIVRIADGLDAPAVLQGMRDILARSPDAALVMPVAGLDRSMPLLSALGRRLHGVAAGGAFQPLHEADIAAWRGHVLAAREGLLPARATGGFSIHPAQLHGRFAVRDGAAHLHGQPGDILFAGPFWHMPDGLWRFCLGGSLKGRLRLRFTDGTDFLIAEHDLSATRLDGVLLVPPGVDRFGVAGVADGTVELSLREIAFERPPSAG